MSITAACALKWYAGIPVRTTMDNSTTVQYAGLLHSLSAQARNCVRDIDPQNELTFLRVRSKKNEIMVAPGQRFLALFIVWWVAPKSKILIVVNIWSTRPSITNGKMFVFACFMGLQMYLFIYQIFWFHNSSFLLFICQFCSLLCLDWLFSPCTISCWSWFYHCHVLYVMFCMLYTVVKLNWIGHNSILAPLWHFTTSYSCFCTF